jgi:glucose/arabinose dehydrogenase
MKQPFKRVAFAVGVAVTALSTRAWAQADAPPAAAAQQTQTVPQDGEVADNIRENLKAIKLPPGFHISLYAVVPSARSIGIDPKTGNAFVGTRKDSVWELHNDGHGKADRVISFAPGVGFKDPNGVCFAPDGAMFVVEMNRVLVFKSGDGTDPVEHDAVAQGALIPVSEENFNHGARVCRVGPDGKLYVAIGEHYNILPKDKYEMYHEAGIGAIDRMNQDGSDREVYAYGLRNSVGLDFNPKDKTLWFTDNQVDGMGDGIPSGELNRATVKGQNFGYPWYGGGHTRTDLWKGTQPPANVVFPQVETVAHAADLGMSFYTGKMFPAKYRGGIFSAQHGSWNRTTPIGARIMFTRLKPDGTAGDMQEFASGWLTPDHQYKGRPVDVEQMKDGSLLVSDDYGGAVYRITYTGK